MKIQFITIVSVNHFRQFNQAVSEKKDKVCSVTGLAMVSGGNASAESRLTYEK